MMSKKIPAAVMLAMLGVMAMCLILAVYAHGATTSQKHENSLGVIEYTENPLTYKEGYIVNGELVEDGKYAGIVVRLQPRGTYDLFTEDIFLCDPRHVLAVMGDKRNPVVLVYETVSHRKIQEVGCHDIIAIDEVKVPQEIK
jgi:hypothetical protein